MLSDAIDLQFRELEKEFDKAFHLGGRDLWPLLYQWWKFYYTLNQEIRAKESFEDKCKIIDRFQEYHNKIGIYEKELYEKNRVTKSEVDRAELDTHNLPLRIQEIHKLLGAERQKLGKTIRQLKREKEGKKPPKSPFLKRQKWIQS